MNNLPGSVETERLLLGAAMLQCDELVITTQVAELTDDDFLVDPHRKIARAIRALVERSIAPDRVTVSQELSRRGELGAVGGFSYLVSLDDGLPQIFNARQYIDILKEYSRKRRMLQQVDLWWKKAGSPGSTSSDLAALGAQIFTEEVELAEKGLASVETIIGEAGGLQGLFPERETTGIATGFLQLDRMTRGLKGGELVIIGGRPAMGKTAVMLNMAEFMALQARCRVAVYSLEMSKVEQVRRLVAARARVPVNTIRTAGDEDRQRVARAAAQLAEATLLIDDTATLTIADLLLRARRAKVQSQIDVLFVDYLQLLQAAKKRGSQQNREQDVSEISRGLKLIARDLNIPVVALSQLSRNPEGRTEKRPQLSDLRESGSIEQDADMVIFVYRDEVYYPDRPENRGEAELIVAKQRNGPTGTVKLWFRGEFTRFENPATESEEAEAGSNSRQMAIGDR